MAFVQGIVDALTSGNPDKPELPLEPSIDFSDSLVKEIAGKALQSYIDSLTHGKPVFDYDIHEHGIMYSDYFQGVSTVHTKYDDVYVGTGENAHEALDDALDGAATDGWDVRNIPNEFDPESPDNVMNAVRENNPDMEDDDDNAEGMYCYVSVMVRGVPTGEDVAEAKRDDLLQQLSQVAIDAGKKKFGIGSLFRGTGNSSDTVKACLASLAEVDKVKFNEVQQSYSDEIELALRVGRGEEVDEDDFGVIDAFAYSTLDSIMQEYCHPFTYFGSHPGNGSDIGCWVNMEGLEEAAKVGDEVTRIEAGSLEAIQLTQGQYQAPTPYVWVHNEERNEDSLWDVSRNRPLWHY